MRVFIGINDNKSSVVLRIQDVRSQSDLSRQVAKYFIDSEGFIHEDVSPIRQLPGVNVPALDKPPGQIHG